MNTNPRILLRPRAISIETRSQLGLGEEERILIEQHIQLEKVPDEMMKAFLASQTNVLAQHKHLQLQENFATVGTQPRSTDMSHSLNHLSAEEIAKLPLRDFSQAAKRTNDPKKILLGMNALEQADAELQNALRQYLQEQYGALPAGKIRLNVIIQEYKSAKKGTTYRGYVQAAYGNKTTVLYSLSPEEVEAERQRRQDLQATELNSPLVN